MHLIEKKFQELVCTRWEHVSLAFLQFIDRKEGFYNIALGTKKSKKSKSQRNKVSSELNSLLAEPILATIAYFLHGYRILFLKTNFDWLKIVDYIAKVSRYASIMCLCIPS